MKECTEQLHHLWLEQLQREFADICFQYRIKLRPPIFELSGATSELGSWHQEQRILRLSRSLISNHSWDRVLMVLKHEMAHQLCSEIFGTQQGGHGRDFQKACAMLGVVAPYNRASGDLSSVVITAGGNQQTSAGRKLINRISKLLALAGSNNEYEASLAMQKATEMLYKYNIERSELEQAEGCQRLIISTHRQRMPAWRKLICSILQEYFFVQVICSSLYDPQECCSFKTIELLGRTENVAIAEHCYGFLDQQLATLWQANKNQFKGNPRAARNSYYIGVLDGFAAKLSAQMAGNVSRQADNVQAPASAALVVACDQQLQEFVNMHFPRVSRRSTRSSRLYSDTYKEAVQTGKKLVLHTTVTESGKGCSGLLTG